MLPYRLTAVKGCSASRPALLSVTDGWPRADRELPTLLAAPAPDALDASRKAETREELGIVAGESDLLRQPQPLGGDDGMPLALVPREAVLGDQPVRDVGDFRNRPVVVVEVVDPLVGMNRLRPEALEQLGLTDVMHVPPVDPVPFVQRVIHAHGQGVAVVHVAGVVLEVAAARRAARHVRCRPEPRHGRPDGIELGGRVMVEP